jgi:hypothetical protein
MTDDRRHRTLDTGVFLRPELSTKGVFLTFVLHQTTLQLVFCIMKFVSVILAACATSSVQAYNVPNKPEISRRNLLGTAAGAAALLLGNREALADDDVITPLYFGVGVCTHFFVIVLKWKVFVWIFRSLIFCPCGIILTVLLAYSGTRVWNQDLGK